MKTAVAKAKGRRLQQWIRDLLIVVLKSDDYNIQSRIMGCSGTDIEMSPEINKKFPYAVEAKNQERVNIWKSYDQALQNCGDYEPLLIIKKNHRKPLAILDAEYFIKTYEIKDKDNESYE